MASELLLDLRGTPPSRRRRVMVVVVVVVVVDDNVDTAQSLGTMVPLWGHEKAIAHDGLDALERAWAFDPDLILLDIGLPGLDGYAVARQLRARPATQGILLAAITGWGSEDDKLKALQAGFEFHFTKPVAAVDVQALLQMHLTQIDLLGTWPGRAPGADCPSTLDSSRRFAAWLSRGKSRQHVPG